MYVILWGTIRSREILRYTQKFALSVFIIERLDCIPDCIVLHPRFLISFCFSLVALSDRPRGIRVGRACCMVCLLDQSLWGLPFFKFVVLELDYLTWHIKSRDIVIKHCTLYAAIGL